MRPSFAPREWRRATCLPGRTEPGARLLGNQTTAEGARTARIEVTTPPIRFIKLINVPTFENRLPTAEGLDLHEENPAVFRYCAAAYSSPRSCPHCALNAAVLVRGVCAPLCGYERHPQGPLEYRQHHDPLVALKGAEAAAHSTWILRPIAPSPGR